MSEMTAETRPIADIEAEATLRTRRRVFLLWQLLQATPDHRLSKVDANKRIDADRKNQLDLKKVSIANGIRDELAAEGYLRIEKDGRSAVYALTDEGREYLQSRDTTWLEVPADDPFAEIDESVIGFVRPYLLLAVAKKAPEPIKKGDANRFDSVGTQELGLKPPLANRLRIAMAREGLLRIEKVGRSESYLITEAGMEHLAAAEMFDPGNYQIPGQLWNRLLGIARRQDHSDSSPPLPAEDRTDLTPAPSLPEVVYRLFDSLLREKFTHTGLVPIHEIRERVRQGVGTQAASHAEFDEAVWQLWRERRVRTIPINDRRSVTEQQVADSIPSEDQTFFYLERRDA